LGGMATESPNWVYGTKSSFAAGELTPTIEGRSDLPLYQNGAKKMVNWLVLPSSGVTRRPGTEFIWATQGGTASLQESGARADAHVSAGSGEGESISISDTSSDSGDELPLIALEEELTYPPVAQDPTSRLYRISKQIDEQARFFDYSILDEEDAIYLAPQEDNLQRGSPRGEEQQ